MSENPYLFGGGLQDRATGHLKFGTRWYDPATGAWTQQDARNTPLDPHNANRYAYAAGDPTNNADPTGHGFGDFAAALAGALVGTVTSAALDGVAGPIIGGAVGGCVGGAVTSLLTGSNALVACGEGAAIGAVTGGIGPLATKFFTPPPV